jgi:hypothetical protein
MPNAAVDKLFVGIGQAPAEIAQYLVGARLLGSIAGLASLNAVRESGKGAEAAANAAAEGALFGLGAKALEPLNWIARATGLGGLGAAFSFADNGDPADAIASAFSLGLLGAFGVPRARQPNLLLLQLAHGDFNEAAGHARNRLDVVRGLSPRRRKQEVVQINRPPGLLLEDVARRSDDLLGYSTTPGKRYKLSPSPLM